MTLKRIGFACILSKIEKDTVVSVPETSCKSTTLAWVGRQSRTSAETRVMDIIKHNIEAIRQLVLRVSQFKSELRAVRLSSDILPFYTHPEWVDFYKSTDVVRYMEHAFPKIGVIARTNNVRLSFHPGQFCVLASESDNVVENSIAEFEYHADMIRMMGYGLTKQDFKCNVHISGKRGPTGFREVYANRLSIEARNSITVENEENSWGLDSCLELSDIIPIVLDVHHHFVREGQYISASDPRISRIIDSWGDVRPMMHYSQSREDVLVDHCPRTLPDMAVLLESGHNKQKLRAHSDMFWNTAMNNWMLQHWEWADIMCESKSKNIASFSLYEQLTK